MYRVDEPHRQPQGERRGGGVVRRGPGEREVVPDDRGQGSLRHLPRGATRRTSTRSPTGTRRRRTAATTAERPARTTPSGSRPGPRSRADPESRIQLEWKQQPPAQEAGGPQAHRLPLAAPARPARPAPVGPVGWLVIAYLGSLAVLFVASLWQLDDFSGEIVHNTGFQNFQELAETPVYRNDRRPHGGDRRRRDGHGRAARVPDRLLHGQGGHAAGAGAARGGGAHAALVELPREGLLVADHAPGVRDRELGARALRAARPGLRERGHLARVLVPLAAVHGAADLRRARAHPELDARRVRRPRRQALARPSGG